MEENGNAFVQKIKKIPKIHGGVCKLRFKYESAYINLLLIFFRVAIDLLSLKMSLFMENKPENSKTLLEQYLSSPELDFKDIIGMVCDFLLAGIDTVIITFQTFPLSIYVLYCFGNFRRHTQQVFFCII